MRFGSHQASSQKAGGPGEPLHCPGPEGKGGDRIAVDVECYSLAATCIAVKGAWFAATGLGTYSANSG